MRDGDRLMRVDAEEEEDRLCANGRDRWAVDQQETTQVRVVMDGTIGVDRCRRRI